MDLAARAQGLIEEHAKRTHHLSSYLKMNNQRAYQQGVSDCLRLISDAASDASMIRDLNAPLGVNATHAAVGEET